jgi:hypothetical protein
MPVASSHPLFRTDVLIAHGSNNEMQGILKGTAKKEISSPSPEKAEDARRA